MSRLDQLAHDPEKEDRIMRGLLEAQLEIIKHRIYPPGSSREYRKELDKEQEERSI